jgi:tRNA threonylcarbamoyl adenosine modification protein YeaZ
MRILGIDTSSELSSVALVDGDSVITREVLDGRRHAEVLAVLLREVLDEGLRPELIACGVGPGPYTGLRVGVTTAQVLGLAWSVPVVGICSLDAIAAQVSCAGDFLVTADARRKEAYWARYDRNRRRTDGPRVSRIDELDAELASLPRFGELSGEAGEPIRPRASVIARLAGSYRDAGESMATSDIDLSVHGGDSGATADSVRGSRLLAPVPLYIRRPDAVAPGAKS